MELEQVWLVGFSTNDEQAPTAISLRWYRKDAGWFLIWELQIDVRDEFTGMTLASNTTSTLTLLEVGHVYENTLSYDPRTGTLSVVVIDSDNWAIGVCRRNRTKALLWHAVCWGWNCTINASRAELGRYREASGRIWFCTCRS